MKKIKRFAAVLLAGIMALALLTACGGSGSDNPEFDAKVESAYLDALNKAFGTSFENDDAIRALAVTHVTEKSGADSLTGRARCKTDGDETTVVRQEAASRTPMCRFSIRLQTRRPSRRTGSMSKLCSAL